METVPDQIAGDESPRNRTALLLVDVINHFDFPGGDSLLANALNIASSIRSLKEKARQAGVPIIYTNDNFGRWLSNFDNVLGRCLQPDCRGREFVSQLTPEPHDYIILKPKHSAFFHTPLELLLKHLGTSRVILTGLTTNSCILFTAHDAYMRDLQVVVPSDCVAAQTQEEHLAALEQMQAVTKADLTPSDQLQFNDG